MHKYLRCYLASTLLIVPLTSAAEDGSSTQPTVPRYCVTEIGDNIGLSYIFTNDVNDRGQVVGSGYLGEGNEAFMWDRQKGYTFLDELSHDVEIPHSPTTAINNRGQIVGTRSFGPDLTVIRAYVWDPKNGTQVLEPLPGDIRSFATSINNQGMVIGGSGAYFDSDVAEVHAVYWDRDHQVHLIPKLPGAASSMAYDINASGQVVGATDVPGGIEGWIWDRKNGIRIMPGLSDGAPSIVANAINDRGEIVGATSSSAGQHAVFWSESEGVVLLENLSGGQVDIAFAGDINNDGFIVGYSSSWNRPQAMLWDSTRQMHNLNHLLVTSNINGMTLDLENAKTISNSGAILATGNFIEEGIYRHFLLTPARQTSSGGYDCSCIQ